MAYDKTAIWGQIDSALGTGLDVTGPEFNTLLKNMYESLEQLINNEATNRSNADIDLSDLISDEAALRVENDNLEIAARASAINAESVTRQAEDEALRDILDTLVDYQIVELATPTTDPGTVTAKKVWFASENGTYTYFLDSGGDPYIVNNELVMFMVDTYGVLKRTLKTF
jgi:hypothetical protein